MTSACNDARHNDESFGRRRLSLVEQARLLDLALPAVFSTVAPGGWVHSVPVHFTTQDDEVRVIAEHASVKVGHVRRTGRATLCVVTDVDRERRYVTIEGPVRIEDGITQDDLDALCERYRFDPSSADDEAYSGSITLVLRPERWIGWADGG